MITHHLKITLALLATTWTLCQSDASARESSAKQELYDWYQHAHSARSDIYEHVPMLKDLARECESVTEIGVRSMVSTWGILYGLTLSSAPTPSYLGIDLALPPRNIYYSAQRLAEKNGIAFHFLQADDRQLDIEPVDMLFIDSLHTYCHLTYELERFSPQVSKYIAMHDTSAPWGHQDDDSYHGNYAEYPPHIDRTKRGLWPAVEDFLSQHPEWTLWERRENNHGFTVLKRVLPRSANP